MNKTFQVAIVESTVLGVVAFHAKCLHCSWASKRLDGARGLKRTEQRAAAHGRAHAEKVDMQTTVSA